MNPSERIIKYVIKEIFLAGYTYRNIPVEEFKKYSDRFINENYQRIVKSLKIK